VQNIFAVIGKGSGFGFAKTRLEKDLGQFIAQDFYRAFLSDFFTSLSKNFDGIDKLQLFLTPPSEKTEALFRSFLSQKLRDRAEFLFQPELPFFERLYFLFNHIEKKQEGSFIHLTGTDIPDFPFHHLTEIVDKEQIYIGEDEDGGFYYLGARSCYMDVFEIKDFLSSGMSVCEAVKMQARRMGVSLVELPNWADVDTKEDLVKCLCRSDDNVIPKTHRVYQNNLSLFPYGPGTPLVEGVYATKKLSGHLKPSRKL
jgi:glycosyltransferase A (GT-A) superfamily protein (DUF2064 family)